MVSLRNRTVPKQGTDPATGSAKATRTAETSEPQQPPASRKRKAEESGAAEEETDRPSTPPPAKATKTAEPEQKIITTPGRVGPIKPTLHDCSPDIKPFKGPPGKKVRKTAQEKAAEYKKFVLENEGHAFNEYISIISAFVRGLSVLISRLCSIHVCYEKGPNGSPSYDKSGFELDYKKVANWMRPRPYNKSAMVRGMDKAVNEAVQAEKRMAELFFEKGEAPEDTSASDGADYWRDRVSKDLNIPWHKIGVAEFEQWDKMGFKKARKGEYETFTQEETDRMVGLMSGASLRK
ncbi:hypothetical protein BP6252_11982 [Coleophoma cylindrospora]|uniref:Uncharacterized protein n=1 Tax=Coleophoma cylindrospora TaxID=1849047 RepID=A0A3D8QFJ4_9HELO|nr:hypothetical protein BP6252_11982 [Coleophoma cylindrospora]